MTTSDTAALVDAWARASAILFDFDGVLADSEPLYHATFVEVFARHGHHIPAQPAQPNGRTRN